MNMIARLIFICALTIIGLVAIGFSQGFERDSIGHYMCWGAGLFSLSYCGFLIWTFPESKKNNNRDEKSFDSAD